MDNIKRISKSALLGDSNEKSDKVYISPTSGKVSNKPSADSVAVPRSTWYKPDGELDSPLFSIPQVKDRIKFEASEMAVYFPGFDLYEDGEAVFWLGKIDGMGEVKVIYPSTYPAQKFDVLVLDLEESFNVELKQLIWSYDGITPAGAIIVTMRLFLLKLGGEKKCNGT